MDTIRVLLADDHALFREGLASIIQAQPDMEIVGEANDGLEALVKAKELKPDLILMDITMPGCDGLEATRQIKQALPEVVIVVLTVHSDEEKLFEAIKEGAQGYLLKNIRSETMLQLIRGALRGEAAITPVLAGYMLEEFRRLSREHPAAASEPVETLTFREQEVLGLVATGATKLHVNNRYEAARYARYKGLL